MATIMANTNNNALNNTNEEKSLYAKSTKEKFFYDMIHTGAISEDTARNYERILKETAKYERVSKRDLNKFGLKQIEKILYDFKANNLNTIEAYARIISSYLNWSVKQGLSTKNPLEKFKPNDFMKYLTNEEVYFTSKQLERYEDNCENYQDSVILRLLYVGVGGKQMSEIRNLTKKDIDWENKTLRLTNSLKEDENGFPVKKSIRYLEVDDRTLELIDGALKQTIYKKKNGQMKDNPHVRDYADLVHNDYVVRASITSTDASNKPADKFVIYRRIDVIAEAFKIEKLTAKFIQRSGMMYQANKLIGDGELTLDDLKIVAEIYGLKSYHNLKGVLSLENIRKTYPIK